MNPKGRLKKPRKPRAGRFQKSRTILLLVDDPTLEIRLAALAHCRQLAEVWEKAVPASELMKGFVWNGERVHLMGQQGIFKPRQMAGEPLSLKSTLASRYEDEEIEGEDIILYDYAPPSRDYENAWTRSVVGQPIPLIYLKQVSEDPSEYMVAAPVFVVGDDPSRRKFALSTAAGRQAVDDGPLLLPSPSRAYAELTIKQRLHQAHFRRNILAAYKTRCAVCELRVRPLLDGAHILPDAHAQGEPKVSNGLSLCALHHRAFDRRLIHVTPDYTVKLRDVPIAGSATAAARTLRDYDSKPIWTPKDDRLKPDRELLKTRLDLAV